MSEMELSQEQEDVFKAVTVAGVEEWSKLAEKYDEPRDLAQVAMIFFILTAMANRQAYGRGLDEEIEGMVNLVPLMKDALLDMGP